MSVLIIDGENFKGKIKAVMKKEGVRKLVWHTYDFRGLLQKVLDGLNIDKSIFYFARIKEHEDSREKSKQLIDEQRLLITHLEKQGFDVTLSGRVRGHIEDGFFGKKILIFKEKGVDVKIAVDMVSWSCDGKVEEIKIKEIILGSSDSDLQPAIKEIKRRGVSCIYLGFEDNPNKGLSYTTDKTILIRNSEVKEFHNIISN